MTKILWPVSGWEAVEFTPGTHLSSKSEETVFKFRRRGDRRGLFGYGGRIEERFLCGSPAYTLCRTPIDDGFLFFRNAAIAVAPTRPARGLNIVAIVDFDIHDGNGSRSIFRNDADAFFAYVDRVLFFRKPKRRANGASSTPSTWHFSGMPEYDEFRLTMMDDIIPPLLVCNPELVDITA